jgi:hypothetical protein
MKNTFFGSWKYAVETWKLNENHKKISGQQFKQIKFPESTMAEFFRSYCLNRKLRDLVCSHTPILVTRNVLLLSILNQAI